MLSEIQGVAHDLHACASDDVACRLLVPAGVREMSGMKAEDSAVGEQLLEVGVGVTTWFLCLVLGINHGAG